MYLKPVELEIIHIEPIKTYENLDYQLKGIMRNGIRVFITFNLQMTIDSAFEE
jgi:hypothetical protein